MYIYLDVHNIRTIFFSMENRLQCLTSLTHHTSLFFKYCITQICMSICCGCVRQKKKKKRVYSKFRPCCRGRETSTKQDC